MPNFNGSLVITIEIGTEYDILQGHHALLRCTESTETKAAYFQSSITTYISGTSIT
jgi:hypothetical protein